jgi:hypothetical protein
LGHDFEVQFKKWKDNCVADGVMAVQIFFIISINNLGELAKETMVDKPLRTMIHITVPWNNNSLYLFVPMAIPQ